MIAAFTAMIAPQLKALTAIAVAATAAASRGPRMGYRTSRT
jgi:hypothetical protein